MCWSNDEMGLFCLTSAFTLTFARRVKGTGLRWGIFTFSFAFPFALTSSFSFSFALGRGTDGMREVGVIIKERGRRRAGGGVRLREEDSAGRRGRTLRAGAGIGPEVPGASEAPAGGGKLPEDGGGGRW